MEKPAWKSLCCFVAGTALLVVLAGLFLPAWANAAAGASLLHNSDQFACNLSMYATEADCLGNGGSWSPSRKWAGGWGTTGLKYGAIDCATCHVRRPTNGNIKMLAASINAADGAFPGGGAVTARQATPDVSSDFGDDADGHVSSEKICEVCHSQTRYHRFDTTDLVANGGDPGHFNNTDCIDCHRHRTGFRAGCSDCHGNGDTGDYWPDGVANNLQPEYASADQAGSHLRHVASLGGNASCGSCHPLPESGNSHLNTAVDLLDTPFSYAPGTKMCSNISCHGNTGADWGATSCLGCHGVAQGNRAAVGSQFGGNSHHVQGVAPADSHCFACHWEANSDGTIAVAYHGGNANPGAAVDLVIYGANARPSEFIPDNTAVQYTADGSRTEIAKLNGHCLGCHSTQNNTAEPFGDDKTPKEYAWDGTSVAERYSQSGTTFWGKYTDTGTTYVTPKSSVAKAYSSHGNAVANQGGWDLNETWPNTRNGTVNIACFDCHNSHGSSVAGTTTSYNSATANGGILKDTQTDRGGYSVTYKPAAGGTVGTGNLHNAGASLCFDCHLNATGGATLPWGYGGTFGASQQIMGYYDTPFLAPGNSGPQLRYPYRQSASYQGGHFSASSPLESPAMGTINGLCTPCHDPHGVSPTLAANQPYGVPLLKGTWLTSPYLEDAPPASVSAQFIFPTTITSYRIDQNTFGGNINTLVTGITESESQFAGLCLQCHPKENLTDGITHNWKSKDRIHESVKGWKTANGTVKHRYSCSKCHSPHMGSSLPRLMVTNCLDPYHKGRSPGTPYPKVEGYTDWDERAGRIPGGGGGSTEGGPGGVSNCHEGASANNHNNNDLDHSWNLLTPWYAEPVTLAIGSGPSAGSFTNTDSNLKATVVWDTNLPSNSAVDYGATASYGSTLSDAAWVTSHSIQLQNLTNHSTYHYLVRSVSPGSQNVASSDNAFYVSLPPTVPALIPEADFVCAADCATTLAWNASTDPIDGGSVEYAVQVSGNPSFSPVVAETTGYIAATEWTTPALPTDISYYWRVRSRDANHTTAQDPPSAWSAAGSFIMTTGNPPVVTLTYPGSGSTVGSYDGYINLTFQWSSSPAATDYSVEVSTDNFATTAGASGWITTTSWSRSLWPALGGTTNYSWRVKARAAVTGTETGWTQSSFTINDTDTGSCPFLFTWDGEQYVFEADLYGAGKLALKTKTGYLKPEPHDYYLLGTAPVLKDGRYDFRLVEERFEADYLDELKLYALDVPDNRLVYAEKPQAGGTTPFTGLAGVLHTIAVDASAPASVVHVNTGTDVTAALSAEDDVFVTLNEDRNLDFTYQTLELDLGDIQGAPQVKIVMDAISTFPSTPEGVERSSSFGPRTILEVQDGSGNWNKVAAELGSLPKPPEFSRPYVFDISNIWLGDSRRVRFTFLFKTRVDWILVDTTADGPIAITEVPLAAADLRLHGIDPKSTDQEIYQYVYGDPNGAEAYLPGAYTRFGDVAPLLTASDDKFAIYGGGDEIALTFTPPAPPAAGIRRSLLVYPNGYYKDLKVDVPHTVEPLPFADMSNFPYDPEVERYPEDAEYQQYRDEYNTRIVLP